MMQIFNQDDIRDLRENPTDHTKLRIVDKLSRTLSYSELTPEEHQIAEQILRLMASDISTRIRIAVSEKFCENNALSHDIALKLANDIEDFVAIPMLQYSEVLNDDDLINIISHREPKRQSAVARRSKITNKVSYALISTAEPQAIEFLLENEQAKLSPEQTDMILKRFNDNERVLKQLISCNRVSLEQAHDLISKVSEDLRKAIIVEYEIPASTVSNLVQGSREWVILSLLQSHADKTRKSLPLRQIVDKLYMEGDLSFTIMLKSLTYGDFDFFCAALAKISGLPEQNIQALVDTHSQVAIEALFKKAGLPLSMVKPVIKLLEIVQEEQANNPDIKTLETNIIKRLVEVANNKEVENMAHLVTIITYYSKL